MSLQTFLLKPELEKSIFGYQSEQLIPSKVPEIIEYSTFSGGLLFEFPLFENVNTFGIVVNLPVKKTLSSFSYSKIS